MSPSESPSVSATTTNTTTVKPATTKPKRGFGVKRNNITSSHSTSLSSSSSLFDNDNRPSLTMKKEHPPELKPLHTLRSNTFSDEDLQGVNVEELTLEEKLTLLSGQSLWLLPAIPRLDIPALRVSDGPHGVRKPVKELSLQESYPATCFPVAAALACSWDPALVHQIGQALCRECIHYDIHCLLGPGMNLKRHPCGGRNFEYFSEDPFLTGQLAAAFVKGVQESGQVAACAKHFAVNNQESHRFVVSAKIDERTLRELYLRHFEMVVKDADPLTMMCAYNQVNGSFCSEHDYLNRQILRNEWKWDGVLMSDWGAVNQRVAGSE